MFAARLSAFSISMLQAPCLTPSLSPTKSSVSTSPQVGQPLPGAGLRTTGTADPPWQIGHSVGAPLTGYGSIRPGCHVPTLADGWRRGEGCKPGGPRYQLRTGPVNAYCGSGRECDDRYRLRKGSVRSCSPTKNLNSRRCLVDDERCETCRFWEAFPALPVTGTKSGHCRRYPPILADESFGEDDTDEWFEQYTFPGTTAADWCGEYQRKPLPMAKEKSDA